MPADTAAVTSGSAHCGGKCDGCAKTSPISVTTAAIVAWRPTLFLAPVHLQQEHDSDHRANGAANRGEENMVGTERREYVAARHDQKAGEPRAGKLFGSGTEQPAGAKIIECEPADFQGCHPGLSRSPLFQRIAAVRHPAGKCKSFPCRAGINSQVTSD